jgi:hypothetical protein
MQVISVSSASNKEGNVVGDAYSQLSLLIDDLLIMLVNEQDSEGYDSNFSEVWIQILKTLSYQAKSLGSVLNMD